MNQFDSAEFKRYRSAFITHATMEQLISVLVYDAFLAKILLYVGLSEVMTGIVTTFMSVAYLFQIVTMALLRTKISTKKIAVTGKIASNIFFMLIYFVPFLPLPSIIKQWVVAAAVLLGYGSQHVVLNLCNKWLYGYVDDKKRAAFSAKKEAVFLGAGIVFALVMSWFVDQYESRGDLNTGYLIIAFIMLLISVVNFISLIMVKDESAEERESMREPLLKVCKKLFSDKVYVAYFAAGILSGVVSGMHSGFIGTYKIVNLGLSLTFVQFLNIGGDLFHIFLTGPVAKFSGKYGYIRGLELASVIYIVSLVILVFTTPQTWWLIIPYTLAYGAFAAASVVNNYNVNYQLIPPKYIPHSTALYQIAVGLTTLLFTLVGGWIMTMVQNNGNTLFGIPMYAQQVQALVCIPIYLLILLIREKYVAQPIARGTHKMVE